jgi:hypothetical protein
MQAQKICFKGDEVLALVKGGSLSAQTLAKLALVKGSNEAIRLRGLRFHYAMENQFYLYTLLQGQEEKEVEVKFMYGDMMGVDFEELD